MTSVAVRPLALRRRWALGAAGLLLASAVLQLLASIERWVVAADGSAREDSTIEDHRFDYSFPADPWENVGSAAQLHGIGTILLALGVLAAHRAFTPRGRVAGLLALLVAVSFGLLGLHALVSGVLGAPTPLQNVGLQLVLSTIPAVALVALALLWATESPFAAVAAVFLLGATLPGYLLAAFAIAPMIMNYQSYDTTPWTEAVVAASIAVAGLLVLVARPAPRR
ncbi:hypothetical protein GRS96_03100 [Rathayibacter sp. VKM Ac-2803]|uniref:hypothetical protein n=1 Tax=Rathayibacter sp. VKM Ac-2803 TaxID=2609256 RepID=UPI00135683B2|nr:hypothetical protein [Rathayibacter sp. VKM Ac-2803]MWV48262.1 hypothetical protein [Rathayibacter sp. VKM Ac-2803]